MKRIVILIDGTWDTESSFGDTNVAKLDPGYTGNQPLIRPAAANGVVQKVFYHPGVGTTPDFIKKVLGGAIGLGLKKIIENCYATVVDNYVHGDEIYIFGFSRGAYAARALAGLIGTSGIGRGPAHGEGPARGAGGPALGGRLATDFDILWNHYRASPAARAAPGSAGTADRKAIDDYARLTSRDAIHQDRNIKCVGVWDTVGSYGIPAGIGLAALARYVALVRLGFHDTSFGNHIDVGLHAVGIDEKRRPFVPTFWTVPKGSRPRGTVEQTWFAGVHCNVGGGYPDSGLADEALMWMIARVTALTGLEFDIANVKNVLRPNSDGQVYDSSKGWLIDEWLPHLRVVLSPDAIAHGYFFNTPDRNEVHINERVHWSVLKKLGRPCTIDGVAGTPYRPANLPAPVAPDRIAELTIEEQAMLAP
jgi:uncharacterized protein (DUF2235 family)